MKFDYKKITLKEGIELKNITYKYPNTDRNILSEASLSIPVGKSIGIMGLSGIGKTTSADVLLGLLNPQEGSIVFDGVEKKVDIDNYPINIGYVPQTIFIRDDTIRNNIAFGILEEDIDGARIEEAVKANEMTNIKDLTKVMNDLMAKWKNVKSAGKEKDDELWAKFLEQRKAFFAKRDSYFESMKSVYAERTEKKKDIIAKAKRNLAISEFTKDEVAAMEDLRKAWKEVGSAGKENEDSLWQEFSTIMKKYFDNKKYYD